jgi:hypothetical protein
VRTSSNSSAASSPARDARVVFGADQKRLLRGDRARVELGGGSVDRDAGLVVPGHDRPLDRRSSPPAWKQRRMDVQPARALEQAFRDQRTVGRHDDCVRILE